LDRWNDEGAIQKVICCLGEYRSRIAFFNSWQMSKLQDSPNVRAARRHGAVGPVQVDGEKYLDDVLKVRTPADALAFLDAYGDPCIRPDEDVKPNNLEPLLFDDILAFQKDPARVSLTPLTQWPALTGKLHCGDLVLDRPWVELELVDGYVQGIVRTDEGAYACGAVLWLQKATGAEYKLCARSDCASVFALQSQLFRIAILSVWRHG
jgi:hypothetical protein